jgi:hypothetical protein
MHLLPTIRRRPRTTMREPALAMTPRDAAIELLGEHLDNGRAGLDPYDETIFILDAHANEHVWARRCLELTGIVVGVSLNSDGRQTTRYRAILEADVRYKLALDCGAPTMDDEPLASRAASAAMDATFAALPAAPRVLTLVGGRLEPEAMVALRQAKDAFERSVH